MHSTMTHAEQQSLDLRTVLLVEEASTTRSRIAQTLRDAGYRVQETDRAGLLGRARMVGTGHEPTPVDLIVCDVQALEDATFAALRELRHYDWVLPMVLLARAIDPVLEWHSRRLHARTIVAGRIELAQELKETVGQLLGRAPLPSARRTPPRARQPFWFFHPHTQRGAA
jgi:response regulator RpfG family c-di-GMP phosphodiesterase